MMWICNFTLKSTLIAGVIDIFDKYTNFKDENEYRFQLLFRQIEEIYI